MGELLEWSKELSNSLFGERAYYFKVFASVMALTLADKNRMVV